MEKNPRQLGNLGEKKPAILTLNTETLYEVASDYHLTANIVKQLPHDQFQTATSEISNTASGASLTVFSSQLELFADFLSSNFSHLGSYLHNSTSKIHHFDLNS